MMEGATLGVEHGAAMRLKPTDGHWDSLQHGRMGAARTRTSTGLLLGPASQLPLPGSGPSLSRS